WKPEIEAKAIASSVVNTCSVDAVSPIAISSYVLLSMKPRFIQILLHMLTDVPQPIVLAANRARSDPSHRCGLPLTVYGALSQRVRKRSLEPDPCRSRPVLPR